MQAIDLNFASQVSPYFFFSDTAISGYRQYVSFKIDWGFAYFARSLVVKYPEVQKLYTDLDVSWDVLPGPELFTDHACLQLTSEFFDNARAKARQNSPITIDLYTSPGMEGVREWGSPNGTTDPLFHHIMTATPRKAVTRLNYLYMYGDVIRIDLTGQIRATENLGMTPVTSWIPSHVQVMVEGYFVPESGFEMWKGA